MIPELEHLDAGAPQRFGRFVFVLDENRKQQRTRAHRKIVVQGRDLSGELPSKTAIVVDAARTHVLEIEALQ
ncbi:hypothetical protein D3C83_251850 [compost metagenome]